MKKEKHIKKFISRRELGDAINNKRFAWEKSFNSRTTIKSPLNLLWRPHNYRREITVKPKTNSTIQKIIRTIPKQPANKLTNCQNSNLHTLGRKKMQMLAVKDIPPDIVVHHIDGNPANNELDNLKLIPTKEHTSLHRAGRKIDEKDNVWVLQNDDRTETYYSMSQHTNIITVFNYRSQVTIQYFNTKLIGIFTQRIIRGKKETFLIARDNMDAIESRISEIIGEIRLKIDSALRDFVREFGIGFGLFKPKWSRYENWIKGDDYIDKIPKEVIIHDTVFKKVYDKGIEFTGKKGDEPGVRIKNYIKNRAIEDISPEIAKQLENIYFKLDTKQSEYELCKEVIEESEDIASMLRSLKQSTVQRLPEEERELLTKKIHRRFGV